MPRLAVLLCLALGAVHASADTCTTLWSKLARLSCVRDRLRDRVHALPLPDGSFVPLRCSDDFSLCTRADFPPANVSAPGDRAFPPSGITRPVTTRRRDTPAPHPTASHPATPPSGVLPAASPNSASVRRHLLSTPTSAPTPAPTLLPTPAPSLSPVPTTADITTWSQLRNAVADPAVAEINVGVDIAFPAPIDVTRNVTIVGVGGADTALRDAGAPLERLFNVGPGGALRIESLHLLNNASYAGWLEGLEEWGFVINAVQARVELAGCTVRDSRGGGWAGALFLTTSTSLVTNCTFTRLEGGSNVAIEVYLGSTAVVESSLFHDNLPRAGVIVGTRAFSLISFLPPTPPLQNLSRARRH